MSTDAYRLALRDYLYELRERAHEATPAPDFERGYAMAVRAQLDSLENKLAAFGVDSDALIALDDV